MTNNQIITQAVKTAFTPAQLQTLAESIFGAEKLTAADPAAPVAAGPRKRAPFISASPDAARPFQKERRFPPMAAYLLSLLLILSTFPALFLQDPLENRP